MPAARIVIETDDGAESIDSLSSCRCSASERNIDCRKHARVPDKAVKYSSAGITVVSDNLTPVIEANGLGEIGMGNVKRGEHAFLVTEESVQERESVSNVPPGHLSEIIDAVDRATTCWKVDCGDLALTIDQKAVRGSRVSKTPTISLLLLTSRRDVVPIVPPEVRISIVLNV